MWCDVMLLYRRPLSPPLCTPEPCKNRVAKRETSIISVNVRPWPIRGKQRRRQQRRRMLHSRQQLMRWRFRILTGPLHTSLHTTIGHCHAIGVHLLMSKGSVRILHASQELPDPLSMTHRAILVLNEQVSEVSNLVVERGDLRVERIILSRVHFDLGLQVG